MHGTGRTPRNALRVEYLDWAKVQDDLRARMRELDAARWAMGEVLQRVHAAMSASDEVRRQFAAQGASLKGLGDGLGLSPGGLDALRRTAEAFPARERVSGVGWEHHHAVALRLPDGTPSARKRWLRDAARHGWSASQLARRLREAGSAEGEVDAGSPARSRGRSARKKR